MQVGVLGPVQFDGGDSIRPRTRKVLSVLALTVGEEVKADRVADALWGESPPASWSKQVQICIWDLRRHLGPELVQTGGGGYRLTRRLVETDAERFEQLANEAQNLVATGTPERAATALERALELWRGPAYEELASWPPGRIEIERLDELRRVAEETLVEAKLASGEHRAAAAAAATLAAKEPLRERRWWLLALAHYRTGNQAAALRALGQARRVLVDELGIDPGPELVELEAAILQQDKSLTGPGAKPSSAHCPFKGLVPFEAEDADLFFGRDAEIMACLARLDTTGFLVVAGPSGCGKSSIVRAGVVPALRARNLDAVVIVPGSDAELAMSSALASTTPHAVLVVDQFEELFAGHHADDAISSFAERIARHAAERAPVIVTIRSDHLGRLGAQPALARLVETSLHLIGAPGAAALRKAIEQPAAAAGLRLGRDLATGEVLAESPHGYQSGAGAAGVVIAARIDGILNELDPMTLEPIGAPFPGTNGPVTSLGVDGAGRLLLVRAADDTVRLYDIATRTPIGDPIDTGTLWADAVLRDDGRAAAAITRQGIVVWDLDPDRWVEAACAVAGRSLTREEWAQYIGNLAPYDPAC